MINRKRLFISILVVVILVGLGFLLLYLKSVRDYKATVAAIHITDPDISTIPDGTYTGEYDVDFIYAKVKVTVKSGNITAITLIEHKNGGGMGNFSLFCEITGGNHGIFKGKYS